MRLRARGDRIRGGNRTARTTPSAGAGRPRSRPRIVIVGGNFAGLRVAQQLDCNGFAVTVVDRSAHFEWLPNLHELVSGLNRPADLRLSMGRLVRRAGKPRSGT